jgi:hypothetical protein
VQQHYSISPAGSGRSPFQDNARHHIQTTNRELVEFRGIIGTIPATTFRCPK